MHTSSRTPTYLGLVVAAPAPSARSPGTAEIEPAADSSIAATTSSASPSASDGPELRQEVASLTPRAVLTYDGGPMTLDTQSGEALGPPSRRAPCG